MKKNIKSIIVVVLMLVAVLSFVSTAHAAKKIKLNKKSIKLDVLDCYTLKVKGTKGKVKWSSSKKKVAIVKDGLVIPLKSGTTTITAKVKGKKLKCKVKVKKCELEPADKLALFLIKKGKWDPSGKCFEICKRITNANDNSTVDYGVKFLAEYNDLKFDRSIDNPDLDMFTDTEMKINLTSSNTAYFGWLHRGEDRIIREVWGSCYIDEMYTVNDCEFGTCQIYDDDWNVIPVPFSEEIKQKVISDFTASMPEWKNYLDGIPKRPYDMKGLGFTCYDFTQQPTTTEAVTK